jgi:hypothetical protein
MQPVRRILILTAAALLAPAAGALAATKTYCVTTPAAPPGCSGTSEASLSDALTAANADTGSADLIVLPAGTQTSATTFTHHGLALEIDGQGTSTVITLNGPISGAVVDDSGAGSPLTLHSLEVVIPQGSTTSADGIDLYNASDAVSDVTVIGGGNGDGPAGSGISLGNGGTVSGTTVRLPGSNAALATQGAAATITDSTLSGGRGVFVYGAGATIARSALSSIHSGALDVTDGYVGISDSLLSTTDGQGILDISSASATHATTVIGSFLTIAPAAGGTGFRRP